MGADFVVDHHKNLKSQIKEVIGIDYVDYILCLNETDGHFESMKQLVAPQGKICSIVQTKGPVDLGGELLHKSATFVWESCSLDRYIRHRTWYHNITCSTQ